MTVFEGVCIGILAGVIFTLEILMISALKESEDKDEREQKYDD